MKFDKGLGNSKRIWRFDPLTWVLRSCLMASSLALLIASTWSSRSCKSPSSVFLAAANEVLIFCSSSSSVSSSRICVPGGKILQQKNFFSPIADWRRVRSLQEVSCSSGRPTKSDIAYPLRNKNKIKEINLHLLEQLFPLLFILLLSDLQVSLKLDFEGLHIDFQMEFSILCSL